MSIESSDKFSRLRYKYWPDRAIGELLSKNWMETAVPLLVLVLVIAVFASLVDNFLSFNTIAGFLREGSELGFLVLGMSTVLILGGIVFNGMKILNFVLDIQDLFKGVILLIAVTVDSFLNPRNEETGQQGDI